MATTRSQIAASLLALAVTGTGWATSSAGEAAAVTGPRTNASGGHALLAIDSDGSGLALRAGARLAPAKVLDLGAQPVGIGQVIEDQGGAERREDAGTQVTVDLQAEVLFAKDSARLGSAARSHIASVAREIEPQAGTTIRVYGFTDDLGSAARGEALSRQRAVAVQGVLAEELKGAAVSFDTRGFGERQPVASNATEAGRQKNRRVQISFPAAANPQGPFGPANTS